MKYATDWRGILAKVIAQPAAVGVLTFKRYAKRLGWIRVPAARQMK